MIQSVYEIKNGIKQHTYGIVGQDEAKTSLEDNLRLMEVADQPQKIILLEGPQGTGKTTIVKAVCGSFVSKNPDKFLFIEKGISDYTEGIHTSKAIDKEWSKLENTGKKQVLFIDEAEEVLITRGKGTHIRAERTNTLTRKLNLEIPNLLIILATNRPIEIDSAIRGRCMDRIKCELPTHEELKEIIDLHMPYLDDHRRSVLHESMINTDRIFNGRDIKQLSNKIQTKMQLAELDGKPELSTEDIVCAFLQLERSKRRLKDDYLDVEV